MKTVIVKKVALEKLSKFHPWIYKDEIKKLPKNIDKGDLVKILSPDGEFLGLGYINPDSLITVRILTFKKETINKNFFKKRIENAYTHRLDLLNHKTNAYRIIHSEGDFISGLIVDKYGDYLSVQFNTAGISKFKKEIVDSLIEVIKPKGIYEKVDKKVADIEGLEKKEKVLFGTVPDEITIVENSIKFFVSIKEGQKTGFFLDQRKNREIVSSYVKEGFTVLDLFSNAGGFGIYCLKNEASFVDFVDISKTAVSQIKENCRLNNLTNFKVYQEDAFDFLNNLDKKYDLIIIDPPAFAKTRKEKKGAIKGFQYLVINSIKALKENGLIAIFSCSHHITQEDLKNVLLYASSKTGRKAVILEHMFQDLDHPHLLNAPSSFYLKGFLAKVL